MSQAETVLRVACLAACQTQHLIATCPEFEGAATLWDEVLWPTHSPSSPCRSGLLCLL